MTHRSVDSPIRSSANNFDNLDKAFVIFKLPGKGRLHRRVDLISAPKQRYAAAVLSWSGSMMFERDLRCVSVTFATASADQAIADDTPRTCKCLRVGEGEG